MALKAELHIQTGVKQGKAFLKKVFFTPPFKVANITEDKRNPSLHLMIMSSSPGVLDGDEYLWNIEVEEHTALHLHTQSYQRLFTMKGEARQCTEVHIANNASLVYLPHPVVPHEASNFTATNKIYLQKNSSLIWSEVLTCGRKLNGEIFRFTRYHNCTEIFLDNKLVIKENLLLQPALDNVTALGQLEGFTHQASLHFLHPTARVNDLQSEINEWLTTQPHLIFGISTPSVNGLVVRLLGYKGEQLHQCLQHIAQIFFKGIQYLKPVINTTLTCNLSNAL